MKTLPKQVFDFDAYLSREERELVLVYLGSSTCRPCLDPGYKVLLAEAKSRLAGIGKERRLKFRTIGVSKDWSIQDGIDFLRDSGEWSEIVVGNNLYNSAVMEHVWSVPESRGAIPQVILFERRLKHAPEPHHRVELLSKRHLLRLLGKKQLEDWLAAGLPL